MSMFLYFLHRIRECVFLFTDLSHEKYYIFAYLTHKERIARIQESLLLKHVDDIDSESLYIGEREVIYATTESISIHAATSLSSTEDYSYTSISIAIWDRIRYERIGKKRLLPMKNLFYLSFRETIFLCDHYKSDNHIYSHYPRNLSVSPGNVTIRAFPPPVLWCLLFPRTFLKRFG